MIYTLVKLYNRAIGDETKTAAFGQIQNGCSAVQGYISPRFHVLRGQAARCRLGAQCSASSEVPRAHANAPSPGARAVWFSIGATSEPASEGSEIPGFMKLPSSPKKVAYLGVKGLPGRGGAERVVEALARRMPAHGFKPVVYCDRAYTPPDYSMSGSILIRLPAARGKHSRAVTLDMLSAFHAVTSGDFDLVHLHHAEASFVLPLLRLRYPVVATSHGNAYTHAKWGPVACSLMRAMDLPFAYLPSAVTCVWAEGAASVAKRFGRSVQYIRNGVGNEIKPDKERAAGYLREQGLEPNGYLLFVAGRIGPTKGAHVAIEAVNRLAPPMPLLLVGDETQVPSYTRDLRAMAGPNIHFRPPIEDPGLLYGLMQLALAVIFPSTAEAMSMVLLEAASLGVPVVASDIPANRDVLGPEGIFFVAGDAAALTQCLISIIAEPHEARAIADGIAERVRQQFSWDEIALRYAQLYRDVCNHHASS